VISQNRHYFALGIVCHSNLYENDSKDAWSTSANVRISQHFATLHSRRHFFTATLIFPYSPLFLCSDGVKCDICMPFTRAELLHAVSWCRNNLNYIRYYVMILPSTTHSYTITLQRFTCVAPPHIVQCKVNRFFRHKNIPISADAPLIADAVEMIVTYVYINT
jgi:hypothetical protein